MISRVRFSKVFSGFEDFVISRVGCLETCGSGAEVQPYRNKPLLGPGWLLGWLASWLGWLAGWVLAGLAAGWLSWLGWLGWLAGLAGLAWLAWLAGTPTKTK